MNLTELTKLTKSQLIEYIGKLEAAAAKPRNGPRPAWRAPADPARDAAHAAFKAKCEAARAEAIASGKLTAVTLEN